MISSRNKKIIWTIYIRSLAPNKKLGDPYGMDKAAKLSLFPQDETIFSLYRMLTYGQQRMVEAENLNQQASNLYNNQEFDGNHFISTSL